MMLKRITKFITSGIAAALTEYSLFTTLFLLFGTNLFIANSVSFLCGLTVSFLLNKHWVFQSKRRYHTELIKYTTLAIINLGISTIALYVTVTSLGIDAKIAKIIVMGFVAIWNYALFSRLIFSK